MYASGLLSPVSMLLRSSTTCCLALAVAGFSFDACAFVAQAAIARALTAAMTNRTGRMKFMIISLDASVMTPLGAFILHDGRHPQGMRMTDIIFSVKDKDRGGSDGPFKSGQGREPRSHRAGSGRAVSRDRRRWHRRGRSHEGGRPDPWRLLPALPFSR